MRLLTKEPRRRGFTLIELLVVIAIIAILIALLVPAVQKVREAAARSQCQNNLKQMALAMHMYQDTYKKLPAGWVTTATAQPNPGWSWGTVILPFIEQAPLYNLLAPGGTLPAAIPANTAGTPIMSVIPIYQCPSDKGQQPNGNYGNYATTNYVINRWVLGPDGSSLPTNYKIQTIPDGSSNTILIGERDITWNTAGSELIRHSASSCSFEGRMGRGLCPQPAPGTVYNTGSEQRLAFSSLHTGGANFAFADGSIHFLATSLDCDPNDAYTNFPGVNSTSFNGQRLELPNDGLPITYNF